jgi:hypothetical protein
MMRLKTVLTAALITAGAAFVTAGSAGSAALPAPHAATVDAAGPAAPLVQINHRRKYHNRRRYSNYFYVDPWRYRRYHHRRHYARRSCWYNYYGDLVCGRRSSGHYRPNIYFGFGF